MLTVLTVNNTVKIQLYVGLIQGSTMSLGGAICLHADCSFSTYFIVQNDKKRHNLNNLGSLIPIHILQDTQREFEYTKGVIKIRILKKNTQHNGQTKKSTKRQTTIYKTLHIKLKIE